jgi:hypothetical protein
VKVDPVGWSAEPAAVVTALREPLYIEYYFRALTERAADIVPQAPAVLTAALAQPCASRGQTHHTETEGAEPDWATTEDVVLDVVRALANKNADLAASLNEFWERALAAVQNVPETDEGPLVADHDPLNSAVNRPWGHGLQTVLALAAWEFRNHKTIRLEFEQTLDGVTDTAGLVGLEFRAVLASRRPLLEGIASTWLETQSTALFEKLGL